jgi:MYXO-CTERM domain-containing protein
MKKLSWGVALGASIVLGPSLFPEEASACGGFFCSQNQGVNQAAERIVFATNDDGTVTAVIEIQYQGPSDEFSWLLPIPSVPMGDQIQVGSSLSFQRLQQATNPQYVLTTRVEGTCDSQLNLDGAGGSASGGGFPSSEGGQSTEGDDGVTVEASGLVGSFEWAVISLDSSLSSPADAAVTWLNANDYDVPEGAPGLLGPYLQEGLYLLALKLQKGASAGSIRPIVLTYEGTKPMIPIKLTAVAANDDMGVLTWLLGKGQAVPQNYYALELNEARINLFNPNANYNDVVIAAANEAGGQGFVTEYAQPASMLGGQVWFGFEQTSWESFKAAAMAQPAAERVFTDAVFEYSQWDGFWDVVRQHVELPPGRTLTDVQDCPDCWNGYVVGAGFMAALEKDVIEPARVIQELIDAHPQITRLYSTLSAEEMTVDPLFAYNADLAPISNLHTAERVIECSRGYYTFEAPWRIELPQGGIIRGGPNDVGSWPAEFDEQPANRRILRRGEAGSGKVIEDNSRAIDGAVSTYSNSVPLPPRRLTVPDTRGPALDPETDEQTPGAAASSDTSVAGGCGCKLAPRSEPIGVAFALLGVTLLGTRRRRRR